MFLAPLQAVLSPSGAPCWWRLAGSQRATRSCLPGPSPRRHPEAQCRRVSLPLRHSDFITAQHSMKFC